jgi:hypothetical protein
MTIESAPESNKAESMVLPNEPVPPVIRNLLAIFYPIYISGSKDGTERPAQQLNAKSNRVS